MSLLERPAVGHETDDGGATLCSRGVAHGPRHCPQFPAETLDLQSSPEFGICSGPRGQLAVVVAEKARPCLFGRAEYVGCCLRN
jgi:hypothetical protein